MELTITTLCTCGKELVAKQSTQPRRKVIIEVEPCGDCMKKSEMEGYARSYIEKGSASDNLQNITREVERT